MGMPSLLHHATGNGGYCRSAGRQICPSRMEAFPLANNFLRGSAISLSVFGKSFCSQSNGESISGSKRRARGPVMAARKTSEGKSQEDARYKHTVDLPQTSFSMRANSVVREPEIQKLWEEKRVLERLLTRNKGVRKERRQNLKE